MNDAQHADDLDDSGGYDLAPEQASGARPAPTPGSSAHASKPDSKPGSGPESTNRATVRRHAAVATSDSSGRAAKTEKGDDEASDAEGDDEATEGSLAPPISRETNAQLWLVVAGVSLALISISFLAGAPQLSLPVPTEESTRIPELGFLERVTGVARTAVYMPLATLAAVFGILCLAFVRQRPVGDVAGLFSKCAAIVGVGMLVWLVPSDIRFVKQLLNVLGAPMLAGAMSVPIFRIPPRDAAIATMCSVVGMMLLVLTAMIVVWATGA